jgi:hypothetical protein
MEFARRLIVGLLLFPFAGFWVMRFGNSCNALLWFFMARWIPISEMLCRRAVRMRLHGSGPTTGVGLWVFPSRLPGSFTSLCFVIDVDYISRLQLIVPVPSSFPIHTNRYGITDTLLLRVQGRLNHARDRCCVSFHRLVPSSPRNIPRVIYHGLHMLSPSTIRWWA